MLLGKRCTARLPQRKCLEWWEAYLTLLGKDAQRDCHSVGALNGARPTSCHLRKDAQRTPENCNTCCIQETRCPCLPAGPL